MGVEKIAFAARCASHWIRGGDVTCPYCSAEKTEKLGVKHFVLQLRKCSDCGLQFRAPKASLANSDAFYQEEYTEGHTTETPDDARLSAMKANNFNGDNLSYAGRIAAIRTVCSAGRVLDYGASWGYGVFQLQTAGYDAQGLEVSRARAQYAADKLGVAMVSDADALADNSFDVIHTAHVLEHIPDPRLALKDFARLLKPGGYVVLAVPNGDGPGARELGARWPMMIGEAHVLALTAEFLTRAFGDMAWRSRAVTIPTMSCA